MSEDTAALAVIGLGLLALIGIATLPPAEPRSEPERPAVSRSTEREDRRTGLGYRMTGKPGLGIEIAPGLVYGFDGQIGVGFGF